MRIWSLILATSLWLSPAVAAPLESEPKPLSGGHYAGALLSSVAGTALLGFIGLTAGFLLADDCDPEEDSGCGFEGLGEGLLGAAVGVNLGAAIGVSTYAALTEHTGSFSGALLGSLSGTVLGIASTFILGEDGVLLTPLFISGGAVVGYTLGGPSSSAPPSSAALLDLAPDGGLELNVPAVGWSRRGEDTRWSVQLVSGQF